MPSLFEPSKSAALIHEGVLYRAQPKAHPKAQSSVLDTEVTDLIRGIWAQYPDRALTLLRERIFLSAPPSSLELGMIRVAAKRYSILDQAEWNARTQSLPVVTVVPPSPEPLSLFMSENPPGVSSIEGARVFIERLLLQAKTSRPVAAALLDPKGVMVGAALNSGPGYPIGHAEQNLLRSLAYRPGIESGSTLLVSLKPCAMCAALILALHEHGRTLRVFYLRDDPGPLARNSCLTARSELWLHAGKPELQMQAWTSV